MKSLILTFLSLLILSLLIPVIHYPSWWSLALGSFVLTLLNMTVKPLLQLLFLPMTIITLGFFRWVINGLVLGLAVMIVPSLSIQPLVPFGVNIGWFLSLMVVAFLLMIVQRLIDLVI